MSLQMPDSMPWRIYQAYLCGPGSLIKLFEEAFSRQALYGPPNPDQQQRTIDALSDEIGGSRRRSGGYKHRSANCAGTTFGSCAGTLSWRLLSPKTLTTPAAHLQRTRPGRSGPRACGGRRAGERADSPGTAGRRSGLTNAPTARSSTGRVSAGAVMLRWLPLRSCATAGSRCGRSCWRA